MRIATWNVNSIKQRLDHLLTFLQSAEPDVVCLQELKCIDEAFPRSDVEAAGYNVATHGQKAYNGVAILSKRPLEDVRQGLPGDDTDEQARYLEGAVPTAQGIVRVASIYLPNGNPVPGPKFDYKLAWFDRLIDHAATLLAEERAVVLAGDYNVIPTNTHDDTFSVRAMASDALLQPESQAAFRRLKHQGWTDAIRTRHPQGPVYTFWDYQAGAWARDAGFRIDHLMLSPVVADRLTDAQVDKAHRGRDKASDHAPTWVRLG